MKKSGAFLFVLTTILLVACDKYDLPSANNGSVGDAAHDLLSADDYTALEIQIQYMPGVQPASGSVANLEAFLAARLNKPGGISITQQQIGGNNGTTASLNQVRAIESENRTLFTEGETLRVYILFTDGNYDEEGVIGIAYRNTSICIFGKTVADHSGDLTQPSQVKLETTVLQHEIGHLLGLVDRGTQMVQPHKDGDGHGSHCNNSSCLMYYQVETTAFLSFLFSGNIPTLDNNCLQDLQANGGK